MRRRQFIGLVGGAVTLSRAAKAQQPERPRRVGTLPLPTDLCAAAIRSAF
jgi:hypothetical protein